MRRLIAEWIWRATLIAALGWIGWELHQIHQAMLQPVDEATTATAPDDVQNSLDDLNDGMARINEKVDAMMLAMLQLKR